MPELDEVVRRLANLEGRVHVLEEQVDSRPKPPLETTKPLSVREFLNSVNPTTDLERTLFIGHYIEKYELHGSFNVDDLRNGYSRAKEPLPANLNDAVNKNIQKGLLMAATERKGGTKAWVLTNSGERVVSDRQKTTGEKP
jgi:hypothetical protein